jgi:hypothetical protein
MGGSALEAVRDVMIAFNAAFAETLTYMEAEVTVDDHHIAGRAGHRFSLLDVQVKRNQAKRRFGEEHLSVLVAFTWLMSTVRACLRPRRRHALWLHLVHARSR